MLGTIPISTGVFQAFTPGRVLPVAVSLRSLPLSWKCNLAVLGSCKLTEVSVAFNRSSKSTSSSRDSHSFGGDGVYR